MAQRNRHRTVAAGDGKHLITVTRSTDYARQITYIATCGACRDWTVRSAYATYCWARVADHQNTHKIEARI